MMNKYEEATGMKKLLALVLALALALPLGVTALSLIHISEPTRRS